jgi:FlaA1/EpsC-like NDP-sugar epimerase
VFLTDLFFANIFLPISAFFYSIIFQKEFVYFTQLVNYVLLAHLILTAVFIVSLLTSKHYEQVKPSINQTVKIAMAALLIIFAVYYLIHREAAFSRIIIFPATIFSAISIVAWRMLVSPVSKFYKKYFSGYGNVVLLAEEPYLTPLINKFDNEKNTQILGIVAIENLDEINIKYPTTNSLVIGSKANWYPTIIKLLSEKKLKRISIFWLSPDSEIIRSF